MKILIALKESMIGLSSIIEKWWLKILLNLC